jgi:starch-binding outer membrane protein, SusD/RagB family
MNMRNWNRMLYGLAGLVAAAGVTYACKDFLDQPPQGTVEVASLETKAGVEGMLIAAYRSLDCSNSSGAWGCAASNWVWGSVTSGDAYKGSNLGDQQPINDIESFYWSVGSADGYLNQKWGQAYEGVSRANAALRLLKTVQAKSPNEISAADANSIRGEALFLRAHYHFEAYRMWGHIPYYFETDTTPVAQGGFRKPNNLPLTGIIDQIIADLDTAAALLPATPRGGDKGRVTKWTARAYKGRVQVYGAELTPAMWNAALTTLRAVKDSGPYALQPSFDQVWTARLAYRNGPETILAYQSSVRDGEPNGANSNFGERLNFPHSGSHFGCCGFHQPSYNLVNFFQVDAAGLPIAITSSAWNNPDPDTSFAVVLGPVDPRLDWTVGRDNVPYKDWTLHNRSWIRDASYSGPFSPKKNVHEQSSDGENNVGWQATQTNDVPMHIFRYADALLLLAEAEVEVGTLANALAIVNQIRARAGAVAQGCGTTTDSAVVATYATCATDTSIAAMAIPLKVASATLDTLVTPWASYRIGLYPSFPSQAYARQAVHIERRLELAMEGQRFFDLRRWGGADTVIANYRVKESARIPYISAAATFTLPKYQFYPIPSTQIQLSALGGTPQLQQNPGW